MDNKSLSHITWKCQYHIVFIPKYRKKILYGQLRQDVREIIKTLCKYKYFLELDMEAKKQRIFYLVSFFLIGIVFLT